jgi:hypothetical protein
VTEFVPNVCPVITWRNLPERTSQSRTPLSYIAAVASMAPSGENATEPTGPDEPSSTRCWRPAANSQTQIDDRSPCSPEARYRPSGEKARLRAGGRLFRIIFSRRSARSHTTTWPFVWLATARYRSSGEKAIAFTCSSGGTSDRSSSSRSRSQRTTPDSIPATAIKRPSAVTAIAIA